MVAWEDIAKEARKQNLHKGISGTARLIEKELANVN